jgi:DNA-binding HxlR family transcriptional regulator
MPTMTAAERRELERFEYNAYFAECPTRQMIDTLGDKWVTLILCALADGPRRYTQLARRIAGVSQKMLTQTLRTLERDGFVTREVTPSVPVRVDYALTPLGESLMPVVRHIKMWAEANMDAVLDARAVYDQNRAGEPRPVRSP